MFKGGHCMSSGLDRIDHLDPEDFIFFVETCIKEHENQFDEVFIRRFISALYFSLINYWACKKYYLENRRWKGPNQDYFPTTEFLEELYENNLDKEIRLLYACRAASDHYVCNPTSINLFGEKKIIGKRKIKNVEINKNSLRKCLESAKKILNYLKSI